MREEDKVLLLCDILNIDVSKYLPQYLDELRTSYFYLNLCQKISLLRKNNYFRNQLLIARYENIKFEEVTSFVIYAKVYAELLDIANEAAKDNMINPLLSEDDLSLGRVLINFDGNDITYNDMILDERYTRAYKIQNFKEVYLNYRQEVKSFLLNPLIDFLTIKDTLNKSLMIKSEMNVMTFFVIFANLIIITLPLFPITTIRLIYESNIPSMPLQISFYVVIVGLFILDIIEILFLNLRMKSYRFYLRAYKSLIKPGHILKKINKKSHSFFTMVVQHINDVHPLNKNVNKITIIDIETCNLIYLVKIKKHIKELIEHWEINSFYRFIIVLFYIILFVFFIMVMLFLGGYV